MTDEKMKWLLKNKLVCDFRGFPIGRVKKVWYDEGDGPFVIVERDSRNWESIPLRAIHTVQEEIRLKPPIFAE